MDSFSCVLSLYDAARSQHKTRDALRCPTTQQFFFLNPYTCRRRRCKAGKGLAIFNRLFLVQRWHNRHMKTNGQSSGDSDTRHTWVIRFMFTQPVFVLRIAFARIDHSCSRQSYSWVHYIKNGRGTPAPWSRVRAGPRMNFTCRPTTVTTINNICILVSLLLPRAGFLYVLLSLRLLDGHMQATSARFIRQHTASQPQQASCIWQHFYRVICTQLYSSTLTAIIKESSLTKKQL